MWAEFMWLRIWTIWEGGLFYFGGGFGFFGVTVVSVFCVAER